MECGDFLMIYDQYYFILSTYSVPETKPEFPIPTI
jgi:hypothetical protein